MIFVLTISIMIFCSSSLVSLVSHKYLISNIKSNVARGQLEFWENYRACLCEKYGLAKPGQFFLVIPWENCCLGQAISNISVIFQKRLIFAKNDKSLWNLCPCLTNVYWLWLCKWAMCVPSGIIRGHSKITLRSLNPPLL